LKLLNFYFGAHKRHCRFKGAGHVLSRFLFFSLLFFALLRFALSQLRSQLGTKKSPTCTHP